MQDKPLMPQGVEHHKVLNFSLPESLIADLREIADSQSPKKSLSELAAKVLREWADEQLSNCVLELISKPKVWDRTYPLVDSQDQALADSVKWRATSNGWVNRRHVDGKQAAVYLHREILKVTGNQSFQVTFKNGDRLDCRRENLILLTMSELRSPT
ncbi:HNH endonuclease [Pseudanabaena sp. PCC 6802]|uniref:HNH endonuclease n=1 Tax=Pseudanabaena sp. PCC 6802 TaxID=118173 RepID=UPI0003459010|nr:HNH endonuclease [Pseudanabaena sp. PCC 6802]